MSQHDEGAYDNSHRAFLQAFIARSTFTFPEAQPVLAAIISANEEREILPGDVTESEFNSYIAALNAAVSTYDYEIRSSYTQKGPRTKIFALVNTTSDGITQLATTHTADEIGFVKKTLDEMFDTNNTPRQELMAVTGMQATRANRSSRTSSVNGNAETAGAKTQTLNLVQCEKMLKSMVEEGWFEKSGEYYTLSPRAIMELRNWLLDTYNEPADEDGDGAVERIKLCGACREIVTDGQRCQTRDCLCRLHDHCTANFFRAHGGQKRCPDCSSEWTGRHFVGIRAVRGDRPGTGVENARGGSMGAGSRQDTRMQSNSNRGEQEEPSSESEAEL